MGHCRRYGRCGVSSSVYPDWSERIGKKIRGFGEGNPPEGSRQSFNRKTGDGIVSKLKHSVNANRCKAKTM